MPLSAPDLITVIDSMSLDEIEFKSNDAFCFTPLMKIGSLPALSVEVDSALPVIFNTLPLSFRFCTSCAFSVTLSVVGNAMEASDALLIADATVGRLIAIMASIPAGTMASARRRRLADDFDLYIMVTRFFSLL